MFSSQELDSSSSSGELSAFHPELLLTIFSYADLATLNLLLRVNFYFNNFVKDETLWNEKSFLYFNKNKFSQLKIFPRSSSFHLFEEEYKENLSHLEKLLQKIYSLVCENDLYGIKEMVANKENPFTFTSECLLKECLLRKNKKNITLIETIRKNNNSNLNHFIFDELCKQEKDELKLIEWGIRLNISSGFFETLIREQKNYQDIIYAITDAGKTYVCNLINTAIHYKSPSSLTLLLDKLKIDPNSADRSTFPLIYSICKNEFEMAKLLIEHEADIQGKKYEFKVLYYAVKSKQLELIKLLHAKGACINEKNPNGKTSLYTAAQYGCTEVFQYLLENGGDLTIRDDLDNSILHAAVSGKNIEIIKIILTHIKKSPYLSNYINSRNDSSRTPLFLAAGKHSEEICEILLANGANPDLCDKYDKSPLFIASEKNFAHTVGVLANATQKINSKNNEGLTALHVAAKEGNIDTVDALLKSNANLSIGCDKKNWTPLHYVYDRLNHANNWETVDEFLKQSIDYAEMNAEDITEEIKELGREIYIKEYLDTLYVILKSKKLGLITSEIKPIDLVTEEDIKEKILALDRKVNTPTERLHTAIYKQKFNDVKNLITSEGSLFINNKTYFNQTALYAAAKLGDSEIVEYLLTHGADPNIGCGKESRRTPLHISCKLLDEKTTLKMLKLLAKHSCKLAPADEDNNSPSDYASSKTVKDILLLLRLFNIYNIGLSEAFSEKFKLDVSLIHTLLSTCVYQKQFINDTFFNNFKKQKLQSEIKILKHLLQNVRTDLGGILVLYLLLNKSYENKLMKQAKQFIQKYFLKDVDGKDKDGKDKDGKDKDVRDVNEKDKDVRDEEENNKENNKENNIEMIFVENLLLEYFSHNEKIFSIFTDTVINPILKNLHNDKEFSSGAYDVPMLALSFFEDKLLANENQAQYKKIKMI